jgi:hypothetical protein
VSRGQEKSIWERFRSACDRFFTRRHADLAQRKTVWADNLSKKEALCARADALKDSTDWDAAALEMKRLQAEWKTVGPVKKSRSEALWQRFRGAADHFFARYAQRHDIALGERVAAREAICAEMEALAAPVTSPEVSGDDPESATESVTEATTAAESTIESAIRNPQSAMTEPPPDLMAKVRGLRGRWQAEIASRGVDRDRAMALDDRFTKAFRVRRLRSRSRREPPQDGDDRPADRGACQIDRGTGVGGRGRGVIAHDPSGGDAEGGAGGQHDWRQGRRRQPSPSGGRRGAAGAGDAVAYRAGSRSGEAGARGSFPARHTPHLRRDAGKGYWAILISSMSKTSRP